LTAGGDVQLDRIEISVWGWGRDEESWHIGHHVVLGDPALQETWKEVDELLYKTFYQPTTQRSLGIVVATMDTGFKTQPVYYYARRREVVYAVKGSSSMTAARVGHPTKQDIDHLGVVIKDGLDVWPLGTHILKSTVYGRLKLKEAGPGYVHFNKDADAEWYKQLTAERLVTLYNKGYSKQEWRKIRPRNEALDCYVYAYAAALIAGVERINWAKVPVRPSDSPKETSAKASSPRRPPRPNTMQSLLRG
jgi:phage terminase large subunit GpA-like protein